MSLWGITACPALFGMETAQQQALLSGIRRKSLNSSSSEGGSGNLEGKSVTICLQERDGLSDISRCLLAIVSGRVWLKQKV